MSDMDDKLRAAYRGLPREEPGAAVDAAILAASRRALVRPPVSRRWAGPVSIAAVLVLAFGVSLHMQEEKPGIESPETYSVPPSEAKITAAPVPAVVPEAPPPAAKREFRAEKPKPQKRDAKAIAPQAFEDKAEMSRDEARVAPERKDLAKEANVAQAPQVTTATVSTPPPPAPAAPAAEAAAPMARMKRENLSSLRSAPAGVAADAQAALDEPTRELEAIAKLRAEGRHEEADKALAEFRRKRPEYRIAGAMWERVKPR